MIAVAAPSFAVHNTGMFELEGNIAHNAGSTPPYDWPVCSTRAATRR